MALNIRHAETERLASELAEMTGETKTTAVREALRDRLERLRRERSRAVPCCRVECHRPALRASAAPGQAFAG